MLCTLKLYSDMYQLFQQNWKQNIQKLIIKNTGNRYI